MQKYYLGLYAPILRYVVPLKKIKHSVDNYGEQYRPIAI